MTHTVIFSEAAEKDVSELLDYIVSAAGAQIAHRYVDELIDYCAGFQTFPLRGTDLYHIYPGLRTVGYHRRATIAFRVTMDTVTIVRIFHGGRNVQFEFDQKD